MRVTNATFVKSSSAVNQCPDETKPEYAFIGRSNVGKSSLINALTNKKALAKISSKPGKTQLINHFEINDEWYLVDLPGYGYATISKTKKATWQKFTTEYLVQRKNIMCLFLLIDSRHSPQKIDTDFMEWLATNQIPFVIVFTKTDKIGSTKRAQTIAAYKKELLKSWEELPQCFVTSSVTKTGTEELLEFVQETNKLY